VEPETSLVLMPKHPVVNDAHSRTPQDP
jgi:hypothetical protein